MFHSFASSGSVGFVGFERETMELVAHCALFTGAGVGERRIAQVGLIDARALSADCGRFEHSA